MKKIFYQLHIGMFVAFCVLLVFVMISMYLIVEGINGGITSKDDLTYIVSGICVILLMTYSFITAFWYRIVCLDDQIKIIGHRGSKADRTQFDDVISYSDIIDIKIILTEKNSKKEYMRELYNPATRLFYEFLLNNGKTKRVFITTFSKKQRKEMLEIINSKTGKNFSYDTLEKEDLSIYNKRKTRNK